MKICKYCIRNDNGYCTMLKQEKDDGDTCKLCEPRQAPTPPLTQNKGVKGKYSIDWDAYLLEVAKTMMPVFADGSPEETADKSISYAKALVAKLKETLRQGY